MFGEAASLPKYRKPREGTVALVCQDLWRAAGWDPLQVWLEALLHGVSWGVPAAVFTLQSFAGSN